MTLSGEDVEKWCKLGDSRPHKLDLQPREDETRKKQLKWAVGYLTIFFKDAKNIDYEALKNAAKSHRTAAELRAQKLKKAREDWAI